MLLSDPLHFTNLRVMGTSPAHCLESILTQRAPTPAMRFGTLGHALCFGQPVTVYEGERRGKAWTEFAEAHAGEFIATGAEMSRAGRVVDALRAHPLAWPLLQGRQELQVEWSWMGRACSSRIDAIGDDHITELKLVSSSKPAMFRAACLGRLAYHSQLAFYNMAIQSVEGPRHRNAYIVGVEPQPPFAVTVFRLKPRALLAGEKLCRLWMEQFLTCEQSDDWPAYTQSILDLDIEEDAELIFDDPETPGDEEEAA